MPVPMEFNSVTTSFSAGKAHGCLLKSPTQCSVPIPQVGGQLARIDDGSLRRVVSEDDLRLH